MLLRFPFIGMGLAWGKINKLITQWKHYEAKSTCLEQRRLIQVTRDHNRNLIETKRWMQDLNGRNKKINTLQKGHAADQ